MEKERKSSDAQIRASMKYNAKTYERIALDVPKGKREQLKAYAEQHGLSLNSFIKDAIKAKIEQNGDSFDW